MNARYLLGIALLAAGAVAACGSNDSGSLLDRGNDDDDGLGGSNVPGGGSTTPPPPASTGQTPSGSVPTNSEAGKAYFTAEVFPFLNTKCAGCHTGPSGAGTPYWTASGDAVKTYDLVYKNGYAVEASRLVVKGVHSGGSAPALDAAEKTKFSTWLAKETTSGAKPTQQNVLEKFGTCFDQAKFDAIGFQNLRTIRRQTGNNPQNLNENANNCTGCDNAPCRSCHTFDKVTGFVLAYGAGGVAPNYTFEQTKLLSPPYIRQYVATDATGEPVYNPGVVNKSINTVEKAKAYEHPMYKISPTMKANIEAFVQDAVTKYKAGTCGK
jgi:hypothetical protein